MFLCLHACICQYLCFFFCVYVFVGWYVSSSACLYMSVCMLMYASSATRLYLYSYASIGEIVNVDHIRQWLVLCWLSVCAGHALDAVLLETKHSALLDRRQTERFQLLTTTTSRAFAHPSVRPAVLF